MNADLRSIWPKLCEMQKDALVAQALGVKGRRMLVVATRGEEYGNPRSCCAWFDLSGRVHAKRYLAEAEPGQYGAAPEIFEAEMHERLASWEGFRAIVDNCEERGWWIRIDGGKQPTGEPLYAVLIANPECPVQILLPAPLPEALALAFCLACGVEVPAAWLTGEPGGQD